MGVFSHARVCLALFDLFLRVTQGGHGDRGDRGRHLPINDQKDDFTNYNCNSLLHGHICILNVLESDFC